MRDMLSAIGLLVSALLLASCTGGGQPMVDAEPVVCQLEPVAFEARVDSIGALLANHRRATESIPNGYMLHFEGGPSVRDQVIEISKLEAECCPFLEWEIGELDAGHFSVRVTGPEDAQPLLADVLGVSQPQDPR